MHCTIYLSQWSAGTDISPLCSLLVVMCNVDLKRDYLRRVTSVEHRDYHCKVTDSQLHACHSDIKGHSGIMPTLGNSGFPILYKSQKQKVVTRSSTEAELVCMYAGVDLTLCYRHISQFLWFSDKAPLPVYHDNTSSKKIPTMGRGSSTNNTNLKQHIEMFADFFTSPFISETFRVIRRIIMGTTMSLQDAVIVWSTIVWHYLLLLDCINWLLQGKLLIKTSLGQL